MAEVAIEVMKQNLDIDLGMYRGKKKYGGINIDAVGSVKADDWLLDDSNPRNKKYYLTKLKVNLRDLSGVDIYLFKTNTCDNGETLELHIATGSNLNATKGDRIYTANPTTEIRLKPRSTDKLIIRFVVYAYNNKLPNDLFELECGANSTTKITVYDELMTFATDLKKFREDDPGIGHTPDIKNGSIIVGKI